MVYSQGNLDYIAPVRYPEDLDQMSGRELAGLLKQIAGESIYEVLVVDVGSVRRELFELMECFDTIYMPIKDDCVSAAKLEEFEDHLRAAGKQGIEGKNPETETALSQQFWASGHLYGSALWGELGDYVRQLWKGTGRKDGRNERWLE